MTDKKPARAADAGRPPIPDTPGQPTPTPQPDLPPGPSPEPNPGPSPIPPGPTPAPTPEPTPIPPAAQRALAEAAERRRLAKKEVRPKELGGRDGPEPVRYGDWEKKGLAVDF